MKYGIPTRLFNPWLRFSGPEGEDVDPVVAAAWAHVDAGGPLREGEHMAMARFQVEAQAAYQRPSASMNLMQWRVGGEIIRADRLSPTTGVPSPAWRGRRRSTKFCRRAGLP